MTSTSKRFPCLYLWDHCCPLLLQHRGRCIHSGGWKLEGCWWPPAPWWQRTEGGSGARGSAGLGQYHLEQKQGLSPGLRAELLDRGVQPWWQAEHWLEILHRDRGKQQFHLFYSIHKNHVCIFDFILCLFTPGYRLTWGTLWVPILRYRCQFVSQMFVVVVGDRRALPAQTFRSLQTAGWRRKKSLVGWRCRGTPIKEEMQRERKTKENHCIHQEIGSNIQSSFTSSTFCWI